MESGAGRAGGSSSISDVELVSQHALIESFECGGNGSKSQKSTVSQKDDDEDDAAPETAAEAEAAADAALEGGTGIERGQETFPVIGYGQWGWRKYWWRLSVVGRALSGRTLRALGA
jgi:hypothetical protein